jgi:hypothetical protein
MADAEHSLFSASGADAWGPPGGCPGKPALENGRKTSSEYADEGTAAHELAKWVLTARIQGRDRTAAHWRGHIITVERYDAQARKMVARRFEVDDEMAENVDAYVDRFMLEAARGDAVLQCEQRVHYHDYLGVPKHLAWGTSDGVAVLFNQPELQWEGPNGVVQVFPPGDELQVHDLKYGKGVMVFADTLQLKLYGAGTLFGWEHVANFSRMRLFIHQPRKDHVDELVISPPSWSRRGGELRPTVPRVIEAWSWRRRCAPRGCPTWRWASASTPAAS